jgi:hypothetical protein
MRKSALNSAVATLLGACSTLSPPPATPPAPAAARTEPMQVEAPPRPAAEPARTPPRRPRVIRIDGRSIEAFRESWALLRASLSPAELAVLNDAVVRLAFVRYGGATNLPVNLRSSPIVPELIRERIDGLSYSEIIALQP